MHCAPGTDVSAASQGSGSQALEGALRSHSLLSDGPGPHVRQQLCHRLVKGRDERFFP